MKLSTLLQLVLAASSSYAVSLPALTGPSAVGSHDLQLTDASRTDPFAPTPTPRSLMITLFYPARHAANYPPARYMSPAVGAWHEQQFNLTNGTAASIIPNAKQSPPLARNHKAKLILFSTGLGSSRSLYTTLAEDLASHGYIVATIDNTYDAPVVEFPDGKVIYSTIPENITEEVVQKYYAIRVPDTLFVLKSLSGCTIPGLGSQVLNVDKVGMFGHSLGGATTGGVMAVEKSILGGVNLDGSFVGPVITSGVKGPFVLFGATGHNRTEDNTWTQFWAHSTGWKKELSLSGAVHLTFTDIPALVEILGLRDVLPKELLDQLIGTIDGLRATLLQRVYLSAFFDKVLGGRDDGLYNGPDSRYPEILFL